MTIISRKFFPFIYRQDSIPPLKNCQQVLTQFPENKREQLPVKEIVVNCLPQHNIQESFKIFSRFFNHGNKPVSLWNLKDI